MSGFQTLIFKEDDFFYSEKSNNILTLNFAFSLPDKRLSPFLTALLLLPDLFQLCVLTHLVPIKRPFTPPVFFSFYYVSRLPPRLYFFFFCVITSIYTCSLFLDRYWPLFYLLELSLRLIFL